MRTARSRSCVYFVFMLLQAWVALTQYGEGSIFGAAIFAIGALVFAYASYFYAQIAAGRYTRTS